MWMPHKSCLNQKTRYQNCFKQCRPIWTIYGYPADKNPFLRAHATGINDDDSQLNFPRDQQKYKDDDRGTFFE